MASSSTSRVRDTERPTLCRYFMHGACRNGSSCTYSHSFSDRPSLVCRYYQRGHCSYGSNCRYDHVRQRPEHPVNRDSTPKSSHVQTQVQRALSSSTSPPSTTIPTRFGSPSLNKSILLRPDAPEFVPSSPEYGSHASSIIDDQPNDAGSSNYAEAAGGRRAAKAPKDLLCPYFIMGDCWYGEQCQFTHGMVCDLCNRPALHPEDYEQNVAHRNECIAEYEKEMEESFALARSREMQCGICMEHVMEKKGGVGAQRFGILQNCKHCFCLECIRKWRQAKTFENKVVRSCPECRTQSDFVTPSALWIEDETEKEKLIADYKGALNAKNCKYFKQGSAECPFGNKCFYRHAHPDGTVVQGDSPRTVRRRIAAREGRRRPRNIDGNADAANFLREYLLWEFLEERDQDEAWILELALEFDDLQSDSDDSDVDYWDMNVPY